MNKLEQAARQLLEHWDSGDWSETTGFIEALREALAEQEKPLYRKVLREMLDAHEQAEQEPVAIHQWRKKIPADQPWHDAEYKFAYARVDDFYEARTVYAAPVPVTTPDVCGEVCARAKLCYGCGKALDEANAKFTEQAEQEPVAWMDLHKELGQLRWAGKDIGWDLAIDAVRNRLEELYAAPVKTICYQEVYDALEAQLIKEPTGNGLDQAAQNNGLIIAMNTLQKMNLAKQAEPSQLSDASLEPVAWKHDCAALCTNGVELWVDRCPHCGKPSASPQPVKQEPVGRWNWNEAKFEWLTKFDYHKHHMTPLYAAPVRTKDLTDEEIEAIMVEQGDLRTTAFARAVITKDREKNR